MEKGSTLTANKKLTSKVIFAGVPFAYFAQKVLDEQKFEEINLNLNLKLSLMKVEVCVQDLTGVQAPPQPFWAPAN